MPGASGCVFIEVESVSLKPYGMMIWSLKAFTLNGFALGAGTTWVHWNQIQVTSSVRICFQGPQRPRAPRGLAAHTAKTNHLCINSYTFGCLAAKAKIKHDEQWILSIIGSFFE